LILFWFYQRPREEGRTAVNSNGVNWDVGIEKEKRRNWELKGKEEVRRETLMEEGRRRREGRAGPIVLRTISTFFSESCSSMPISESNHYHHQYQLNKICF